MKYNEYMYVCICFYILRLSCWDRESVFFFFFF